MSVHTTARAPRAAHSYRGARRNAYRDTPRPKPPWRTWMIIALTSGKVPVKHMVDDYFPQLRKAKEKVVEGPIEQVPA